MVIGIIDSGRGGLAVAKRIKKPEDKLIILLDQGFFPYGNKTKEFLLKRVYYLTDLLIQQGAEVILLACNTLSVLTYSFLKYCFSIPILGVFDYFIPYLTSNHTLIGSKTTIQYARTNFPVQTMDGTELIEAIEKKKSVNDILKNLNLCQSELLLLGCTHFLTLDKNAFSIPTLDQISMLEEDLEKIRKKARKPSF